MKSYCQHFLFFSEKIKNIVLHFISAQNVPENDEFSMKTIYKPTTFCGEGFLGLDSIQLLQNSQKMNFSCSLLNLQDLCFFTQNTSSKMELSIVYSFSSIKLKFMLTTYGGSMCCLILFFKSIKIMFFTIFSILFS